MLPALGCVRCGGALRPPGPTADGWECVQHGDVAPLRTVAPLQESTMQAVAGDSRVPLWQLVPPPVGWTVGGIAYAGEDQATVATAVAWAGPSPLGGDADLLVVAEEPGVGLGARHAGIDGLDVGDWIGGRPFEHVEIGGRPVALWACEDVPAGRTALVGEAEGAWLWLVFWPAGAETLLAEGLVLADARQRLVPQQPGAASQRLLAPG